jgi:hypothetical protein
MITISEAIYSDGLWTVVAVVDSASGTFVGPFVLDLPEDATDADFIAAIDAIVNPPPPAPEVIPVEPSGEDDGQDPSVDP